MLENATFRAERDITELERRGKAMPKPTKPGGLILQMLGVMLLVGAIVLAVDDKPAIGLAIVSGVAGGIFFVLGAMASR
jgi:hypothetical protein